VYVIAYVPTGIVAEEIAELVKPPALPTIVAVAVVGGVVAMLIATASPAGGHTDPEAQMVPDNVIVFVP